MIKLDLSRAAQRLSQRFTPRVRVLNYSGSGIETTFTQGEDACLAALVPELPAAPADARAVAAGRRRAGRCGRGPVRAACSTRSASAAVQLPAAAQRRRDCRPSARTRASCWRSPSWPTPRARSKSAARRACAAPFPLGAEGTTAWLQAAADAFGVDAGAVRRRSPRRPRARAQRALARHRARSWPASASSSSPIRSSRSRSRASCRANSACSWSRSARPTCTAQHLAEELALLPAGTRCSEGQDVDRQLDRCRAARPDLVVCGLGLANPLEAEGLTTKWSIELVFTPIQGYEQAGDLAELFARPLRAPRAAGGLSHAAHASGPTKARRMSARCASPPR